MSPKSDVQHHQSWCDHHIDPCEIGSMELTGWCEAALWQHGDPRFNRPELTLEQDGGEGGPIQLRLYSPSETVMQPHEARALAAALLKGADMLEAVR